jgi:hypothetical protein
VCLATQSSIDRLDSVLDILDTWSGPISLSVFTPDLEYDISVQVSILPTFLSSLFVQKCFSQLFPTTNLAFVIIWQKKIGKKLLVKIFTNILRAAVSN